MAKSRPAPAIPIPPSSFRQYPRMISARDYSSFLPSVLHSRKFALLRNSRPTVVPPHFVTSIPLLTGCTHAQQINTPPTPRSFDDGNNSSQAPFLSSAAFSTCACVLACLRPLLLALVFHLFNPPPTKHRALLGPAVAGADASASPELSCAYAFFSLFSLRPASLAASRPVMTRDWEAWAQHQFYTLFFSLHFWAFESVALIVAF